MAGSWQGRQVLVTGAYGFLAGHMIEALLAEGASVVGLVRDCPSASYLQLQALAAQITMVPGDITDLENCRRTLNEYEIEAVFHLAAQATVGIANRSPISTFEANIRGTYMLLEACRELREAGAPLQAVVVASSDKAYGQQSKLPYSEDSPLLGLHPYDASKSCADLLARTYAHTYALPVAVTRCANLYGPGDLNFSRLVPATLRSALRGERPIIRSDGSPCRDYLYVTDAVAGYLTLAEALWENRCLGTACNFGTGVPVSVLEMVNCILAAADSSLEPEVSGTASGEIDHQYLSPQLARAELGWTPTVSLAEGLARSCQWYREYERDHE